MSWFKNLVPSTIRTDGSNKKVTVPKVYGDKCPSCNAILYNLELEKKFTVFAQNVNITYGFQREPD